VTAFDDDESTEDYFGAPMLPPPEESLDEDEVDIRPDEGYSPAERACGLAAWGITDREAAGHEDLITGLRGMSPRRAKRRIGTASATRRIPTMSRSTTRSVTRAGRLVIADIDPADPHSDYWAIDVGVDGAGASAEEAAVHIVPDDEMPDQFDLTPDDGGRLT
jgi:hypothetical protein